MSVLHRVLFTWFSLLIFLILLVLRVDNRTQWNWFVVFIPIWIFNTILLIFSAFDTISLCRGKAFNRHVDVTMNVYVVTMVILKISFEVMLCLKLESPAMNLTAAQILSPVWVILPVLSLHVFMTLINRDFIFN